MVQLLRDIDKPHRALHQAGEEINVFLTERDISGAQTVYTGSVAPAMADVRNIIANMKVRARENIAGWLKANSIYTLKTMPALGKVQENLKEIQKIVGEHADVSAIEAEKTGVQIRNADLIISLVAVILGLFFAIAIARGIIKQVGGEPREIAEIAEMIAEGDLTQKMVSRNRKGDTGIYASMKKMV